MSEIVSETLREVTSSLDDGKYRIVSTLKEGRLYLAEKAGKRFVLKTAAGAKGLEMLKREYELSIGLSHPSLAYVFTWEEDSPVGPCIVQEYIDGRSLGRWLSENPSRKERKRIFSQLLSVVDNLHKKGIIHNDLTPENILISRVGDTLKLIDFGFADDDSHLSHSLGGTRDYASPELLAGEKVDARSDIYSIGRLMQDIFPGRYRNIIRHCLNRNPEKRYPAVGALERTFKRRRLPLKIASAAVVAGLLVFPIFRKPKVVEVPIVVEVESDSLRAVVDSLTKVIADRDKEQADQKAALDNAKARVEAVYARAIPAFRKTLSEAKTTQEVTDAWLAFLETQKEVNFVIPEATPESVRPALRDYIIQRNNEILPAVGEEMNDRLFELNTSN